MRESGSDLKAASVYLTVMSADSPRALDPPAQPPPVELTGDESEQIKGSSSGSKERPVSNPMLQPIQSGGDSANTKSAFEITSVSTYQEDLETSMHHNKGASAEAESLGGSVSKREQSESDELDEVSIKSQSFVVEEHAGSEHITVLNETAPNGPVVASGLRRFRRVNKYSRGRWDVEDASETEERPESEQRGSLLNQNSRLGGGAAGGGGGGGGWGAGRESPFVSRKGGSEGGEDGGGAERMEVMCQHSRSSSEVGGQGSDVVAMGDRELHVDQSSTVAEAAPLSRNTSFSSLVIVTEKSVDEEDKEGSRLRDLESETEASVAPVDSSPLMAATHAHSHHDPPESDSGDQE